MPATGHPGSLLAVDRPSRSATKAGRFGEDERSRTLPRKPVLLSGGNPQIAKGDGDGPVKAYIAAMPGWKSAVGKQVDAIVERTVDDVKKAVRWNSPFYGVEGKGWFLSFHVFTRYVKLTFFNGAKLDPPPPVESKDRNSRHFHVFEQDELDEELLAKWVRQASGLPGWDPSKG